MLKKLSTSILSTLLLLPIVSCQDDLPEEQVADEGKGRITLTFTAEPGPVAKTKAEIRPSTPGSEAEKAGFSYEMIVTAIDNTGPETKAKPVSFKNVTALLFTSEGAFNGRAAIETFQGGVPLTATFTGVTTTSATNCRLVLVADDEAGTLRLANNTTLKNFSGTYTAFCAKDGPGINSVNIKNDADIPYVGSIEGVNLSNNATIIHSIPLYRMLAKVTVSIMMNDMPLAKYVNTQLAYAPFNNCLFGTKNGYDGTGSEDTSDNNDNIMTVTADVSRNPTFYVGDRYVTNGVRWPQLSLKFDYPTAVIEDIRIGEEYLDSESMFILFDFNDRYDPSKYSIRRNHNYDITLNLRGTRADFIARSHQDKRISFTNGKEHAGLCVGRLGGFVFAANGTTFSSVKGYYTKKLLLEPNNSREIGLADSKNCVWNASPGASPVQSDARRFWDFSYIKSLSDYGGMSNGEDAAYYYCNTLTLGNVQPGTWYVPTIQQLSAIQTVLAGMQENPVLKYYSAFASSDYWSSTEYDKDKAWYVSFWDGCLRAAAKSTKRVRCVRDL